MFIFIFLAVCILLFPLNAETLQDIYKKLNDSPVIKSYRYDVLKIQGDLISSQAYPNPEVELEFGRLVSQTESGFNLTSLSISQKLRLWGERNFAYLSLEKRLKSNQYLLNARINTLKGEVYKRFYKALYLKNIIRLREQEKIFVEKLLDFVKQSFSLGEKTELDVLRSKREYKTVLTQLTDLRSRYKAALKELEQITGFTIEDVEGNFYTLKGITDIDIKKLPFIRYLDLQIQSLEFQIKREKSLSKPQISVGLTVEEDPVETGKYEGGLFISSSVPVFYNRKGEILRLEYEKRKVLKERERVIKSTTAALERLRERYNSLSKILISINKEILPDTERALNIAKRSFKNNAISFFEFSSIRRDYFSTLDYKLKILYQIHQILGEFIKFGGNIQ